MCQREFSQNPIRTKGVFLARGRRTYVLNKIKLNLFYRKSIIIFCYFYYCCWRVRQGNTSKYVDGWIDGWIDGQIDGQTDGQKDRQIDRRIDRQIDGQIDSWIDVWINIWTKGRTDK